MPPKVVLSPEYSRPLGRGTWIICLCFAFSGLVPDGGLTTKITFMAILAYLGGVAVTVVRRPQNPTVGDVLLITWGFLPLWLTTQYVVRVAWTYMDRL